MTMPHDQDTRETRRRPAYDRAAVRREAAAIIREDAR